MTRIEDTGIEKSSITIQYDTQVERFVAFLSDLPEVKTYAEKLDDAITDLQNVQKEMLRVIEGDYKIEEKNRTRFI